MFPHRPCHDSQARPKTLQIHTDEPWAEFPGDSHSERARQNHCEWSDEEVQENVLNVGEVFPEGLSTPRREQEFGNGETQNDRKMELYRR